MGLSGPYKASVVAMVIRFRTQRYKFGIFKGSLLPKASSSFDTYLKALAFIRCVCSPAIDLVITEKKS